MPQIVYCGPFDEVDLPALRLRAKPGEPIEVSDDDAAALLEQTDNWQPAGQPARGGKAGAAALPGKEG